MMVLGGMDLAFEFSKLTEAMKASFNGEEIKKVEEKQVEEAKPDELPDNAELKQYDAARFAKVSAGYYVPNPYSGTKFTGNYFGAGGGMF